MKKFLAWMLSLCLLMSCAGALAEEASQAVMKKAFEEKLLSFINGTPEGNAVALSVTPAGSGPLAITLQKGTSEKDGDFLSVKLQTPDMEAPAEIQICAEQVYISSDGQVLAVRYQDILSALMKMASPVGALNIDTEVLQELAGMLVMYTIYPAMQLEQNEEGIHFHLDLKAKEVLQGLAAFGDQAVATEKYRTALEQVINEYAASQNPNAEKIDLAAVWPQLKEQLLAVESDMELDVDVAIKPVDAQHTTLEGKAVFTNEGQSFILALNGDAAPEAVTFRCALSAAAGEQEMEIGVLSGALNIAEASLNATLILPLQQKELILTGSMLPNGIQYELIGKTAGEVKLSFNQIVTMTEDALLSNATFAYQDITMTVSEMISDNQLTYVVTVNGEQMILLDAKTDENGGLQFVCEMPEGESMTAEGKFASEDEYVIDGVITSGDQAMPVQMRTALSGEPSAWAVTVSVLSGEMELLKAALTCAPTESPVTPLSDGAFMQLDEGMILQLLGQ